MEKSLEELQKLRAKAEVAMNKTAQLYQLLAQIDATLSREENQKVTQKSRK
tara:strand:+ start:93 stop:245 length:153 start_codon:yes stop_codon:yes gene_type:complete